MPLLGAPDRILVDGQNLVLRCARVPALARLWDRRGRRTGVLHGTLGAVRTFQEAAPGARLTFVWDGSSQRRKALFAGYKASRANAPEGDSEDVAWLKEVLPLLGVEQAWNDAEECDDVIASIVEARPRGERVVIVSTDRDFLQLVDGAVYVFAPAAKSSDGRRGKLYDPTLVLREYGVSPDRMVLLRAVAGDVSDDLPGVHGIGPKIAAKFWKEAGRDPENHRDTEDTEAGGVGAGGNTELGRGFAFLRVGTKKLTKLQVKRLLDEEDVVRRNVAIMTLLVDVPYRTTPPAADKGAFLARLAERDLGALAKTFRKNLRAPTKQTSFAESASYSHG